MVALSHLWLVVNLQGESIPIRLFLAGYDLTATMRDVNKKFSVRYFLNLVLVDEEDRRYFKQQVKHLGSSWLRSDLFSCEYKCSSLLQTITFTCLRSKSGDRFVAESPREAQKTQLSPALRVPGVPAEPLCWAARNVSKQPAMDTFPQWPITGEESKSHQTSPPPLLAACGDRPCLCLSIAVSTPPSTATSLLAFKDFFHTIESTGTEATM